MPTDPTTPIPWSLRRPQRYFFTAGIVVAMVAVMTAGIGYIANGVGGIVPVLMLVTAPVLGVFYTWYFNFSEQARSR